jgi:D-xylose transport system permease protein
MRKSGNRFSVNIPLELQTTPIEHVNKVGGRQSHGRHHDYRTSQSRAIGKREPGEALLPATEIDTRLLGMIGAMLIIWIGFNILSGGLFLTPRNLWNLSVQTASVAVMATGMVLVIVTRNIDLSVGSILGFVGMSMGVLQAECCRSCSASTTPPSGIIALLTGITWARLIGALHGSIIAFLNVPSFIVTLGGLLVWRGAPGSSPAGAPSLRWTAPSA